MYRIARKVQITSAQVKKGHLLNPYRNSDTGSEIVAPGFAKWEPPQVSISEKEPVPPMA